jgi:hypothetical protein
VGGVFTQAGGVSANNVARFNTQTNTWSTLGTGSSNGVSGDVFALAVVGNEVYVGGAFTLGRRGECEPSGALQHADEHLVNARHGQ